MRLHIITRTKCFPFINNMGFKYVMQNINFVKLFSVRHFQMARLISFMFLSLVSYIWFHIIGIPIHKNIEHNEILGTRLTHARTRHKYTGTHNVSVNVHVLYINNLFSSSCFHFPPLRPEPEIYRDAQASLIIPITLTAHYYRVPKACVLVSRVLFSWVKYSSFCE